MEWRMINLAKKDRKIIELSDIREENNALDERIQEEAEMMTREFMEKAGLNFDCVDDDLAFKKFKELENGDYEFVCGSIEEAEVLATYLLNRSEYDWVSHFEANMNFSPKSYFITLKPIPKENKRYVFLTVDLLEPFYKKILIENAKVTIKANNEKDNELNQYQQ